MTVEIFLSDFQSTGNGVFLEFLFFDDRCPIFCKTVFRLFAFTCYSFAVLYLKWDGNGNDPMGIP